MCLFLRLLADYYQVDMLGVRYKLVNLGAGPGLSEKNEVLDLFRREREYFIDHLLVRIHFIIVMMRWTGLAPAKFELPFSGSLTSTFLCFAEFLLGWTGFSKGRGAFERCPLRQKSRVERLKRKSGTSLNRSNSGFLG